VVEALGLTEGKSSGAAILTRNPSALVWAMHPAVEFSKNTIFVATQHSIAITIKY